MILVTGAAGFIGFHTILRLIEQGEQVFGIDNLNDYYDVDLKQGRLATLQSHKSSVLFHFEKIELGDQQAVESVFERNSFEKVIHLGAQAGVRYSLTHPYTYVDSNLAGFVNIMESARRHNVKHLIYASSSSVYGANHKTPFSVTDTTDQPISLYAATKKANELLAYSYSHLYNTWTTGLRFFTVYGPWGRPDMALFRFTKAILAREPINVFNNGQMKRDFTYIDDIVQGILYLSDHSPKNENVLHNVLSSQSLPSPLTPDKTIFGEGEDSVPFEIYNLGNGRPVLLLRMIEILEDCLGRKAIKNYLPLQPGDMLETYADMTGLEGIMAHTTLEVGIARFVEWYLHYYK